MRLKDHLRRAEKHGKQSAQHAAEMARDRLHHLETSIRRTLKQTPAPMSAHPDPEARPAPTQQVRTGIISVNGQDVGEMRCTGGRHTG